MKKYVLITGSSGLLGGYLLKYIASNLFVCTSLDRENFLSLSESDQELFMNQFDWVVHCAANTNVDLCEREPITAYNDNVLLTKKIAQAVKTTRLLYISSTGVYGEHSCKKMYTEDDPTIPTTTHHFTKLLGEYVCKELTVDWVIFRTGWLYGNGENSNDFIFKILSSIRELNPGERLLTNSEQKGNPTSVSTLAYLIKCAMIGNISSGIYNAVSNGSVTRSEYVSEIINTYDLQVDLKMTSHVKFKRDARVSRNESACCKKIELELGIKIPNWKKEMRIILNNR